MGKRDPSLLVGGSSGSFRLSPAMLTRSTLHSASSSRHRPVVDQESFCGSIEDSPGFRIGERPHTCSTTSLSSTHNSKGSERNSKGSVHPFVLTARSISSPNFSGCPAGVPAQRARIVHSLWGVSGTPFRPSLELP